MVGCNGVGKTTLLKLIVGELSPLAGRISLGVHSVCYVDQHAQGLDPERSVLDNFLHYHPDCSSAEAYNRLALFQFRKEAVLEIVANLSGGEKLRALFACVLMGAAPPELLILDEPTNHLDLDAIAVIEQALKRYQGALLVVSHDSVFLQNIQVDRIVKA